MKFFLVILFFVFSNCISEEKRQLSESEDRTRAEILFGRQIAMGFLLKFPLLRNELATKILQDSTQLIADSGPRKDLRFLTGILDESEVFAFSLPGGYLFFSKGMIDSFETQEDALFVIAHEVMHAELSHSYQYNGNNNFTQFLQSGLDPSGGALMAIQVMQKNWIKELIENGRDENLELEADTEASLLLEELGCSVQVGIPYLKKLSLKKKQDWLSKTHPPFEKRISALQKISSSNDSGKCKKILDLSSLKNAISAR